MMFSGIYICTPHIRFDEVPDDLVEEDPAMLTTSEEPQLAPATTAVLPAFGKPLKGSWLEITCFHANNYLILQNDLEFNASVAP